MKMINVYLLSTLFLFGCQRTQELENITFETCKVLEEAFQTDVFLDNFFVCKREEHKYFRVFDKMKYFDECTFSLLCDGTVEVKHFSIPSIETRVPSNLILEKAISEDSRLELLFYRPYSGAVVKLIYTKSSAGELKLVDSSFGSI